MMDVVLTVAGVGLICFGLRDMFHTLLHPSGQGGLSSAVLAVSWRLSKLSRRRWGSVVGPAAMVAVVALWVALQGIGWALIYYPHLSDGFTYSTGVDPADYPDFLEALYISVVTFTTLGMGDVVPVDPWLRAASPFEALTGFALLTAALAWFTMTYPLLARRRALALHLKGLADVGYADEIGDVDAVTLARVLDALTAEVSAIRIDFAHHTEVFYFSEPNPNLSLAHQLPYALRLQTAALARPEPAVVLSSRQLSSALEHLATELKNRFVHSGGSSAEVFAAYAAVHGHDPRT